ncbi:hypothetical protein N8Z82_01455 [Pelagibacteraceae bacterium]|nr:hypothetical protein [Pelagibacteraceae bacterium]
MFRYQVLIEYIGTSFVGWQIQSKGKSIQKEIQVKLSKLLKEKSGLDRIWKDRHRCPCNRAVSSF